MQIYIYAYEITNQPEQTKAMQGDSPILFTPIKSPTSARHSRKCPTFFCCNACSIQGVISVNLRTMKVYHTNNIRNNSA